MNRSKKFEKRVYHKEQVYDDVLIHRLICKVMKHGNKACATKIVYGVLRNLEASMGKTPPEILSLCMQKIKPNFILRTKKIASSVYKIPVPASPRRSLAVGLDWLVKGSRERKEKTFAEKLEAEMKAVIEGGKSVSSKTKENHNKIAEKNRAFLHYL